MHKFYRFVEAFSELLEKRSQVNKQKKEKFRELISGTVGVRPL